MRQRVLLVGFERTAAASLSDAVSTSAVEVDVAHTAEQAWSQFANRPASSVLIGSDIAPADLRQLCSLLRSSRGRTRISVVVSRGSVPDGTGAEFDLLVLTPTTPRLVRVAAGIEKPEAERLDPHGLLELSCLSGSPEQVVDTVAEDLCVAFGVDRCSARSLREGDHDDLAMYCRASLRGRVPVLVAAPGGGEDPPIQSHFAVALDQPGRSEPVVLCLSHDGARLFSHEARSAFEALARRFSVELTWRALFDRVVSDSDALRESPRMDPALGVWNRAALLQLVSMQFASAERTGEALSVAVLDVLGLADINQRYGHAAGDAVLRSMALATRATVRDEDVVGRFGGDEIAIVLFRASIAEARRAVSRVQQTLARLRVKVPGGLELAVRTSCGIAVRRGADDRGPEVLSRASGAAAAAQANGNDVEVADSVTDRVRQRSLSAPSSSDDIAVTLGSYRLLHEISRGAMGVVYRAEDLGLGRPVAIKMLRPEIAGDPGFVERFQSEAAILAALHHPNLVSVYAFGSDGDHTFFAMELVEGQSVDSALDRHDSEGQFMPLAKVRDVALQIASALGALHDKGIVHRDVKPGNIVLDPFRDRAVLVDVGLAGLHGDELAPAGTPGFIAPEIIAGKDSDARSDVYSLAATVYTMLTMREPYGAGDVSTLLSRQLEGNPALPSSIRPELAPIDAVVMRGLERYPRNRYDTASEFAGALAIALDERISGDTPVIAIDTGPADGPRRSGPQTVLDIHAAAFTRGIVFRSIPRVIGVRATERWRAALHKEDPELSEMLAATTPPLSWQPTPHFQRLLQHSPEAGRGSENFARELGRATIRASFRRFFPASAATLAPKRTLSALATVWERYHTWGTASTKPMKSSQVAVEIRGGLADPSVCAWTHGMLEALVTLSGGGEVSVEHAVCRARGDDLCSFGVAWASLGSQPGTELPSPGSSERETPRVDEYSAQTMPSVNRVADASASDTTPGAASGRDETALQLPTQSDGPPD